MNKLSINRARRMVRPPRRIMRDPDDHGNQPGGGDNQQVNQGDSSNTGDDSNNTGDDADLDAFWNGQADESGDGSRSEEHTSELQSLIRISYAVFCLKKKNSSSNHQSNTT